MLVIFVWLAPPCCPPGSEPFLNADPDYVPKGLDIVYEGGKFHHTKLYANLLHQNTFFFYFLYKI